MSNYLMINTMSGVPAVFGAAFSTAAAFVVNAAPKHRQLPGTGMSDGRNSRVRRPPEIPL